MRGNDVLSRIIGIVVFLGGIALLVFVFAMSYRFFSSESSGIQIGSPNPAVPATVVLGMSVAKLLVRIGLLLVMAIIGSLLASRGIQMYFASCIKPPEA